MLTFQTPETFTVPVKIKSFGEAIFFDVTYRNIDPAAIDAEAKAREKGFSGEELLLKLVESWQSDVPLTEEGIAALEIARPGVVSRVVEKFFLGRLATLEKN